MGKRLTQEYVKESFSKRGYEVLSEYLGCGVPIEFKCSEGHKHSMTWNDFSSGNGCGKCLIKRRHSIEYIRRGFEKEGFVLLSKEYLGNRKKLLVSCPLGHKVYVCWNDFQQGVRCSKCSRFKKKEASFYEKYVNFAGYRLLSVAGTASINTRLLVECSVGHQYWVSWQVFQKGARCRECFANSRKKDFSEIRRQFQEAGYTVLSRNYENANKKLHLVCPVGHDIYMTWNKFSNGRRCHECSVTRLLTMDNVVDFFRESGFIVVSTKYYNSKAPLKVVCSKGHEINLSWNCFSRGRGCPVCSKGSVSKISQEWLDLEGVSAINREVPIYCANKKLIVDGFDSETNTVYEFLGDFWHGNPNRFDADKVNARCKKTFGQLFDETMDRLFLLRRSGYNLKVIWESEYIRG